MLQHAIILKTTFFSLCGSTLCSCFNKFSVAAHPHFLILSSSAEKTEARGAEASGLRSSSEKSYCSTEKAQINSTTINSRKRCMNEIKCCSATAQCCLLLLSFSPRTNVKIHLKVLFSKYTLGKSTHSAE